MLRELLGLITSEDTPVTCVRPGGGGGGWSGLWLPFISVVNEEEEEEVVVVVV